MLRRVIIWLKTIYLSPLTLLLMGGGSNSSSSSSRPLTAAEMTDRYKTGLANIGASAPDIFQRTTTPAIGDQYIWQEGTRTVDGGSTAGQWVANPNYIPEQNSYALNGPDYTAPAYADPGAAKTLTGGDYEKLYNDVYGGSIAGLDYAKNKDYLGVNNDAAKRGIWSSGLAMQGENDVNNAYAPAYAKAGGDATSLVMGLKSGELKNLNDYALSDSAQKNSMNMENAMREYNAGWQPANYLKDIWNGSGGTVSSGSGGGWQFSI
jgi:hypothetical protein